MDRRRPTPPRRKNIPAVRSSRSAAPRRILLFDIDGTLVDIHGVGREAFIRALARELGGRDELAYISFAGNTDRNVLEQVAAARGLRLDATARRRIFSRMAAELELLLRLQPAREIRGARRFLEELQKQGVILGLATGNIRRCAFLKLASAGLDGFFQFGGFGDRHARREQIVRSALAAAAARGITASRRAVCLVGDTPRDIAAARALEMPILAIAAGRYSPNELAAAGADFVAPDFARSSRLLKWLDSLFAGRIPPLSNRQCGDRM